ncbi:hypothetical protein BDA99DRAFT_499979 [Phascolomyces articulosus]|uniref:Uncharacterized protein n=1 Tax=Phascolomyces articulosus TaxID=60185 RepID=A0AAD5PHQ1_9FUNG|nr:hypothetical protein BDA99DRAFT_499979 [Phascolomyces articulosus]
MQMIFFLSLTFLILLFFFFFFFSSFPFPFTIITFYISNPLFYFVTLLVSITYFLLLFFIVEIKT